MWVGLLLLLLVTDTTSANPFTYSFIADFEMSAELHGCRSFQHEPVFSIIGRIQEVQGRRGCVKENRVLGGVNALWRVNRGASLSSHVLIYTHLYEQTDCTSNHRELVSRYRNRSDATSHAFIS